MTFLSTLPVCFVLYYICYYNMGNNPRRSTDTSLSIKNPKHINGKYFYVASFRIVMLNYVNLCFKRRVKKNMLDACWGKYCQFLTECML